MTKNNSTDFLESLFAKIKNNSQKLKPEQSYSSFLINSGPELIAKKVVEEAFEVAIASIEGKKHKSDKKQVTLEAADLFYHLLVLLHSRNVELKEVIAELEKRNQVKLIKNKKPSLKSHGRVNKPIR